MAAISKDNFSAETERRKVTFLHQDHECIAMHNIPNAYPSLIPNEHMTSEIEGTTTNWNETQLPKQMSRLYEVSIPIKDVPEELKNGSADGEETHQAFGLRICNLRLDIA